MRKGLQPFGLRPLFFMSGGPVSVIVKKTLYL